MYSAVMVIKVSCWKHIHSDCVLYNDEAVLGLFFQVQYYEKSKRNINYVPDLETKRR